MIKFAASLLLVIGTAQASENQHGQVPDNHHKYSDYEESGHYSQYHQPHYSHKSYHQDYERPTREHDDILMSETEQKQHQMSYDEYRLWKHQQKLAKKQRKTEAKEEERQQKYHQEVEPEFKTYSEYKEWKFQQKQAKKQLKEQQKREKYSTYHRGSGDEYSQIHQPTVYAVKGPQDDRKVDQHPVDSSGSKGAKTEEKPQPVKTMEKPLKTGEETKLTGPVINIFPDDDYQEWKFQQKQAKKQLREQEKLEKEQRKEHEHELKRLHKKQKERYYGEDSHHLERHHQHDLFDLDDPMSDSDYDDLDEDTGIYHDEDPHYHKSHHVKRHYTEEQYYHSRDQYFPEDSFHAAGHMEEPKISQAEMIAHALGQKLPQETEKSTKQEPAKKPSELQPATKEPKTAPVKKPSEPSIAASMPTQAQPEHKQPDSYHDVIATEPYDFPEEYHQREAEWQHHEPIYAVQHHEPIYALDHYEGTHHKKSHHKSHHKSPHKSHHKSHHHHQDSHHDYYPEEIPVHRDFEHYEEKPIHYDDHHYDVYQSYEEEQPVHYYGEHEDIYQHQYEEYPQTHVYHHDDQPSHYYDDTYQSHTEEPTVMHYQAQPTRVEYDQDDHSTYSHHYYDQADDYEGDRYHSYEPEKSYYEYLQ